MKFKSAPLLILLFLTFTGVDAQPGFNEPFNPFYVCHANPERSKYFFYGEIVAVENLKNNLNVNSKMTLYKATVRVEKAFKEKLPSEISLYIGYRASAQYFSAGNKYLFQAVDGKLGKEKVYFTEVISRPLTDYSAKAVEDVFAGIETVIANKNNSFIEGLVYERLLQVKEISLKKEEADRLARDAGNSQPLADILVEATSLRDEKIYQARSDEEGRFRIDDIPPGLYKIKLYLPAEKEQVEPFTYGIDSSPCSRKWEIPVMPKDLK